MNLATLLFYNISHFIFSCFYFSSVLFAKTYSAYRNLFKKRGYILLFAIFFFFTFVIQASQSNTQLKDDIDCIVG